MANHCYNRITITGKADSLNKLHAQLEPVAESDSGSDLIKIVYEMADKLDVCHPDEAELIPFDVDLSFRIVDDLTAELTIGFDTRWWFDEDFIALAAFVFSDYDVEFYAEEFASAGAVRVRWEKGVLVFQDEDEECISGNGVKGWFTAVRWGHTGWEVEYEQKTPEETFNLFLQSEDVDVRHFAASHSDAPIDVLVALLTDEDDDVASAAWDNPSLSYEVVEAVVRGRHSLPDSFDLTGFPREILVQYLTGDVPAPPA